jgi:hypothetical protein
MIFDRRAADEVLGDDALHHRDRDSVIPGPLGVDDGDGAALTDS